MYLNSNFLKGQIIAQEYVDFFASRGFIFKEAKNCKEELQDYADAHKLSVFKLTDRKIKDKDFYAFYVFDDSKIFGKDYKENCFGEFEDTIIFIGSKDEVNIDNIYIMSSIDKSSKAWQKFSEMVNKDLVK